MEFEYDPYKSLSNLAKHGIDFEEARRLWDSPTLWFDTKPDTDDHRSLVLGVIDGKHWTAIVTLRGGRTRIISVRRSRTTEEATYERNS